MVQDTKCRNCQGFFAVERKHGKRQIYCSKECAKSAHQRKQVDRRRQCNLQACLGLKGGTIGAINEAIVAEKQ